REVRVQELPRQVLLALLERPGEVVRREDLCRRLWPDGTFVDFEHGLNTAVKKLRDALGDAAENPRFIETVPLRGYRFAAPVEPVPMDEGSGDGLATDTSTRRRRTVAVALSATGAIVLTLGAWLYLRASGRTAAQPRVSSLAVLPLRNLSG